MANLEGMDLGTCVVLRLAPSAHTDDAYVVRQAGSGEQATVRIVHAALDATHPLATRETSARFAQEASIVAGLDQPNIVRLYAYGERDGLRYLIMPEMPHGSLADYLAPGSGRLPPLPLSTVASIAGQAAAALQYAHERGVVHSTVNLHTLLLREPPASSGAVSEQPSAEVPEIQLALGDFGLSRFLPGSSLAMPRAPVPDCLAPEQRNGQHSPASDQYALACVLYLLLIGQPAPLHGLGVPPSQLNPALSPEVDAVLMTALSPRLGERYPRILDFATGLWTALRPAAYAERMPVVVSVPTAGARAGAAKTRDYASGASAPIAPRTPKTSTNSPAAVGPPPRRAPLGEARSADHPGEQVITRRRALVALGMLGAVGLAAAGGYIVLGRHLFGPTEGTLADVLTGYDGVGLYHPFAGAFSLVKSWQRNGATLRVVFGAKGDQPLVGDWNGSGVDSVGVFRAAEGKFLLAKSNATSAALAYSIPFGQQGDLAIAGDWMGAGRDGIGVFRPSKGVFLLKQTLDDKPPELEIPFGVAGDVPIAGDWNGDGIGGIGVYRPNDDTFYLANIPADHAAAKVDYTIKLFTGPGQPFAGRWNAASKRFGVGMLVTASGMAYLKRDVRAPGSADAQFVFGQPGDLPVAGRWAR